MLRPYLGIQVRALLHERSDGEPEAVTQSELVLDDIGITDTRIRIAPFIGTEAAYEEHSKRH